MKKSFLFLIFFQILTKLAFTQDTTYLLPETSVIGDRIHPFNSINTIQPQCFANQISDIGTLLRSLPNTSGIRRGGTSLDPVFRGFRNNQLLITTNSGIQVEGGCPNRMDPNVSHFDAEEIRSIKWETGSNMLLFGQAIGGVLIMNIAEPQPFEKFNVSIKLKSGFESNYNGISNCVSIKGGNKKIFFLLTGGYKNYGNYSDGRDSIIKSSFQKDFLSTKIGFALTSNQHLLLGYSRYESRDVLFPALPMDENYDFTNNLSVSFIKYDSQKNENFRINAFRIDVNHLMDNFNRPQANRVIPPNTGIMRAESSANAITTGFNFKKKFHFNSFYGTFGGDFCQINKDGTRTRKMIMTMGGLTSTSTKYDNLWNEAVIRNSGIYAQISHFLKPLKSTITATFRIDEHQHFSADTFNLSKDDKVYFNNSTNDYVLFNYGLRYDYTPSSSAIFTLDFVSAQRSPNMNELYIKRMLVGFDNYDYLGNPYLKPETNHQISLNSRIKSKSFVFGINLFASQIDNYIGSVLLPSSIITPATQGVMGVKQFMNIGTAQFLGGEIMVQWISKNNLEIGISSGYTYAMILEVTKHNILNNQIVSSSLIKNDPMPEIPAMSSSVWSTYKIPKTHLSTRLELEYTMPQNLVSKANYESTTPDYLILNASLSYTFKKWAALNFGINNLLNQAYYNHLNRRVISNNPSEKIKLYEPGRVFFINFILNFESVIKTK